MEDYPQIAKEARLKVLDLIYKAQTSHLGSNFSCVDILTVLFSKIDLTKDKFVLSAGWKAASLYFFLYKKGRITLEELDSYCQEGSKFIGLTEPMPDKGIEFAGGSMGMGFPAAVGFALAKKLKGEKGTVYCLMSDGETQIGTTWEAAIIAAQHKLDNLVVIIDGNGFQAMGLTKDILSLDLEPFFKGAGWLPLKLKDGNNHHQINGLLNHLSTTLAEVKLPKVIIAHTIKGKGVSFMENNNIWHYKAPNEVEYLAAKEELCQK